MAPAYRHRRRIFYFSRNSKDARQTSAAEVVDGRSNTVVIFSYHMRLVQALRPKPIDYLSYGG